MLGEVCMFCDEGGCRCGGPPTLGLDDWILFLMHENEGVREYS